jgi:hypothetical protein
MIKLKRPTFVMSVRKSFRLHSVRLHLALTAAVTYLLQVPDAALPLLNALPPEMRGSMPWIVGGALVALGVYARLSHQPKVTGNGE